MCVLVRQGTDNIVTDSGKETGGSVSSSPSSSSCCVALVQDERVSLRGRDGGVLRVISHGLNIRNVTHADGYAAAGGAIVPDPAVLDFDCTLPWRPQALQARGATAIPQAS